MLKWLSNKWKYVSYLGVRPEMSISQEKKVILTNQLSLIFFVVLILMNAFGYNESHTFSTFHFFSTLSIFTILIIPLMNKIGQNSLTGFVICVATTFFTFLFSYIGRITNHDPNYELVDFIIPKLMGLSYLVLPFVLIDFTRKFQLSFAVIFNLFCILFLDSILMRFGTKFTGALPSIESTLTFFIIFPIAFIILGMIFMVGINSKYENKIVYLLGELKDKNVLLENHKVEISSQMETIQVSYNIIEQKNKNITDSIQYAKSIQASFLPSDDYISELMPHSFILYLPRDIVSGDFYWVKEIDNLKIIIAADCTGHGVPGAFVSILGSTLLNDIIVSQRILKPNQILDELRIRLKLAMKQTQETKQKDGMDISVCVLNTQSLGMSYSGANQTLVVCRNNEIIEVKSDHQPVGVYVKEKPFSIHELEMQAGDQFYIFSDGFQSQFGGENKEKLKSSRFKNLLLTASSLEINLQKDFLYQHFIKWKGSLDQIDDILVIGMKV